MSPPVSDFIATEARLGAHNYEPLGVILSRGEGVWVWDTQGNRYLDCLSAYSAVNQGHCHPKILAAMVEQAAKLTLTSRAFHNDQLAPFKTEIEKAVTDDPAYDAIKARRAIARFGEMAALLSVSTSGARALYHRALERSARDHTFRDRVEEVLIRISQC